MTINLKSSEAPTREGHLGTIPGYSCTLKDLDGGALRLTEDIYSVIPGSFQ